MRYEVTSFDVCVPGFERLRSESEFILATAIGARSGWRVIRNGWLDDLQCCERPPGFDYDAARRVIITQAAILRREWAGRYNPLRLDGGGCPEDGPNAYLYIRDRLHGIAPGAPNLDCLTTDADELEEWAEAFADPDRSAAAFLFPDRPRGMIRAARGLSAYAACKANAMRARAAGRIAEASSLEDSAEITFKALPEFAKW